MPETSTAPQAAEELRAANLNSVLNSGVAMNISGPTPLSLSVRQKGKKPSQLQLPNLLHTPQRKGSRPAQVNEGEEFANRESGSPSGLGSPASLQGLTKGKGSAPGARRQDTSAAQADPHAGGVASTERNLHGDGEDLADAAAPDLEAAGKGGASTYAGSPLVQAACLHIHVLKLGVCGSTSAWSKLLCFIHQDPIHPYVELYPSGPDESVAIVNKLNKQG